MRPRVLRLGIDYNPKAVLSIALAVVLMLVIIMLAKTTLSVCKAAARKRRGSKPLWVRCCEVCFGKCDSYSGVGDVEIGTVTENTPEAIARSAARRAHNYGRAQPVLVDAEEEDAPPVELFIKPGAAAVSVSALREAIADELFDETGEECDPDGLILEAKTGGGWQLVAYEPDLDAWVYAKARRVKRKFMTASARPADGADQRRRGGSGGGRAAPSAEAARQERAAECVPKLPPPVVKDLSNAELPAKTASAPKMSSQKKVRLEQRPRRRDSGVPADGLQRCTCLLQCMRAHSPLRASL